MPIHPDYPRIRIYVDSFLSESEVITLADKQAHYLLHVMRCKIGDRVALFNGKDGEWEAALQSADKKSAVLLPRNLLRSQTAPSDIWLLFAPLRSGRSEWVVEKATELGVSRICPVLTRHTVAERINEAKFMATAIEAAEQCERLDLPAIQPLISLEKLLSDWPDGRTLLYGDESGQSEAANGALTNLSKGPLAVLIGPEGGFSTAELAMLRSLPYVRGMCLGPRVLRADTAAVAALALVQASRGDWDAKPAFRGEAP